MVMLEATVRDEFQDGFYILTVFTEKTLLESLIHVNSDGSTDLLIANINQTLISTNGSVTVGMNGVQHFRRLGEHYKVSTYSCPVVLEISKKVNLMLLAGCNVCQKSKKAVVVTWNYGCQVENRPTLIFLQLTFLAIGSLLISGDFYLTIQGLSFFVGPSARHDL
ncbi:hypothetical protein AeRB84_004178 [Aphanomyces euteiches]|nr:hypothetical protein AeRB84_004178 [Aphanomyces euteiches]